jgi:hypothetical protein
MQVKAIAKVTAAGNLELPPEILAQLEPLSEYEILITEEKIILEKRPNLEVDVDQFLRELNNLESDPKQPTLEEISEIVKEVRQDLWSKE